MPCQPVGERRPGNARARNKYLILDSRRAIKREYGRNDIRDGHLLICRLRQQSSIATSC